MLADEVGVDAAARAHPGPSTDRARDFIGGSRARFAPYADLYRRALAEHGAPELPIGAHSPGFVAADDQQARDMLFPHFKANRDRIGAEQGWAPATREQRACANCSTTPDDGRSGRESRRP